MNRMKRLVTNFQLVIIVVVSLLWSTTASAQNKQPADTLNIGFVMYTKSNTPGTLYARWNYANVWSGPGIATGGPKEGFAGKYHVRYFYENGDFSDEYDLEIEKAGGFYNVYWMVKGKVAARGVGMETESGLAVGWRRIKD